MQEVFNTLVIGAGISGLTMASRLRNMNEKVIILEKSRGVGGRIATRRDGVSTYDHGAQFYKISDHLKSDLDQFWSTKNISQTWFTNKNDLYKSAPAGLTHLAKSMTDSLEIIFEEKVIEIKKPDYLKKYYQVI